LKIQEIKKALSEFTLFCELSDYELNKITDIVVIRKYKKHSHVFLQLDPLENVYFIYDGKIKIYKNDISGKEQIVSIMKKGEMFPHVGFFRKGDYPANAEVMVPSILIVVPVYQFENILMLNPELSIKVFKALGEKIIDLQNRLQEQILNNKYEQIIKLLIRLTREHGNKLQNGTFMLRAEFSNMDLAKMIGTSRETISRTLTKMKKEGLIKEDKYGNLIFVPDSLLDEII
jgi:CRP/FNR family transcriptional regulator